MWSLEQRMKEKAISGEEKSFTPNRGTRLNTYRAVTWLISSFLAMLMRIELYIEWFHMIKPQRGKWTVQVVLVIVGIVQLVGYDLLLQFLRLSTLNQIAEGR